MKNSETRLILQIVQSLQILVPTTASFRSRLRRRWGGRSFVGQTKDKHKECSWSEEEPNKKQTRRKQIPTQITVVEADTIISELICSMPTTPTGNTTLEINVLPRGDGRPDGSTNHEQIDRQTDGRTGRRWAGSIEVNQLCGSPQPVLAGSHYATGSQLDRQLHNAHVAKTQHHTLCAHFLVLCKVGSTVNTLEHWGNRPVGRILLQRTASSLLSDVMHYQRLTVQLSTVCGFNKLNLKNQYLCIKVISSQAISDLKYPLHQAGQTQ